MVSWDCNDCRGSGKKEVIIIRDGEAEKQYESCSTCGGSGCCRG